MLKLIDKTQYFAYTLIAQHNILLVLEIIGTVKKDNFK